MSSLWLEKDDTRDVIMHDMALPIARDLTREIAASGADVVATDFMLLGGYLAAENAAVPVAALVHTVCPLPAPGLPPTGLGLAPADGPLGRLRDRVLWRVAR